MNAGFSLADFQQLEDFQPVRKQDLFPPTLWFIWAQIWNQWTKLSQDHLKFFILVGPVGKGVVKTMMWHLLYHIFAFLYHIVNKISPYFWYEFIPSYYCLLKTKQVSKNPFPYLNLPKYFFEICRSWIQIKYAW